MNAKPQLRITAWPQTKLPLPEAVKIETRLDAATGVLVPRAKGPLGVNFDEERVKSSGETYLRLTEVDLADTEAISAFVNTHGLLGGAVAFASLGQTYWSSHAYMGQLNPKTEWRKKTRAVRAELTRAHPELESSGKRRGNGVLDQLVEQTVGQIPPYVESLDEFRFAARCLRDLTTAWRVVSEGLDPLDVQWVSPNDHALLRERQGPAHLLGSLLGRFLTDFSPQLRLSWRFPRGVQLEDVFGAAEMEVEPKRGPDKVPLYAICALELFNHIIENAKYQTCHNDRCNRTFVHQQGRSEKGQHRGRGVMYCSPSCARATAQRQYRQRKRRLKP